MAIPPPGPGAEHSRRYFARLRDLRNRLAAATGLALIRRYFARLRDLRNRLAAATGLALSELSMGMTDDFEVAIEEGATIVRVGRAIFGERPR
jgi:uncharacterized pyridoxal phosphate-containing UPF0001 family protein